MREGGDAHPCFLPFQGADYPSSIVAIGLVYLAGFQPELVTMSFPF